MEFGVKNSNVRDAHSLLGVHCGPAEPAGGKESLGDVSVLRHGLHQLQFLFFSVPPVCFATDYTSYSFCYLVYPQCASPRIAQVTAFII